MEVKSKRSVRILYIGNMLSHHGKTPTSIETLGPRFAELGYDVYFAGSFRFKLARLLEMVVAILRQRYSVDVILIDTYSSQSFWYAWSAGILANWLQIKYIPILRGGNLPFRLRRSPKACGQLFGKSSINIALSGYLQEAFEQQGFSTTLIPNYLDIEEYTFTERHTLAPSLLWVRSFHAIYNPQMAIHIIHELSQIYPSATLTMVGPNKDGSLEKCKALAQSLGVSDRIRFTGKLSKQEWRKLSEECDVFINTTNFDNMPVSVMEAMALGLPVVSTEVGGVPYLIADSKTGLLVPANDVQAMMNAIDYLFQNPAVVEMLSKAGRRKIEKYDWSVIRVQWKHLLNEAVEAG